MRPGFLLLVAGAVAAPSLPPPLGLLSQWDEGPAKISCFAPRSYAGSTFELFVVGTGVPTQNVTAAPGQHRGDFTLGGAAPAARCYRCRYRHYNGSAWEMSAFSMEIAVNASDNTGCHPPTTTPTGHPLPTAATLRQDPSWLLPVAVGTAGVVLLLLAVVVVAAWRVGAGRRRAGRPPASCWTETRFPTTELSYDNGAFAIGVNAEPGTDGASPVSPQRMSPPAVPHFSTFRSLA